MRTVGFASSSFGRDDGIRTRALELHRLNRKDLRITTRLLGVFEEKKVSPKDPKYEHACIWHKLIIYCKFIMGPPSMFINCV